jgi:hypothetical protein
LIWGNEYFISDGRYYRYYPFFDRVVGESNVFKMIYLATVYKLQCKKKMDGAMPIRRKGRAVKRKGIEIREI